MADESHDCSEIAKVPGSSSSTSSSSDGFSNTNRGKQDDIVTGLVGDFNKHVRGGVWKNVHVGGHHINDVHVGGHLINDVHVGGHLICGEKTILPPLPRFVVLKAKQNGKCLRLTEIDDGGFPAGFLKFEGRGRELASPQAKFEIETAKIGHEFVHIRSCYNKKYLVRADGWIVAAADKPEEDESKISCTLFELERVSGREFRFRHSQRKTYACFWTEQCCIQFHGGLCVGTNADDAYTIVAWESLVENMNKAVVQLPKFVALTWIWMTKNTKYLSLTTNPRLPAGFLQFESEEVASPRAKFEIEMAKSENGLVHIRCCDNNKYLVRQNTTIRASRDNNSYWIVAAADKPEEDEYKISCTLFEPEPYEESGEPKFRLCHLHLGMRRYACMCMSHGGLIGYSNVPHKDACDVYRVVDLDSLVQQYCLKLC